MTSKIQKLSWSPTTGDDMIIVKTPLRNATIFLQSRLHLKDRLHPNHRWVDKRAGTVKQVVVSLRLGSFLFVRKGKLTDGYLLDYRKNKTIISVNDLHFLHSWQEALRQYLNMGAEPLDCLI